MGSGRSVLWVVRVLFVGATAIVPEVWRWVRSSIQVTRWPMVSGEIMGSILVVDCVSVLVARGGDVVAVEVE
jgi:hypothetical protein